MRYVSNFTIFLIPPNIYLNAIVALKPLKLQTKFTQMDLPASLSYTDLLLFTIKEPMGMTPCSPMWRVEGDIGSHIR